MSDVTEKRDELYKLLPAVYRERDAEEGFPLRSLLRLVADQHDVVKTDIDGLWDDFFIETCERWVIPYIGDLVSNNALHSTDRLEQPDVARERFPDLVGSDLRPPIAIRTRADVAKTIYYRRRKGTLPMLEELARDVTGWPARVVEFFELLDWSQHLNHLRWHSRECPDLRQVEKAERIGGPFDEAAHTVDVRAPAQHEGWHNVPNVGFFLWPIRSYALRGASLRAGPESWQYSFSPLGQKAPLFSRWRREGDESALATELHLPVPIRPSFFFEDLRRYARSTPPRPALTDLYGDLDEERSLHIRLNGEPLHPAWLDEAGDGYEPRVVCRCLDPWPSDPPAGAVVAIDVESGRLALGADLIDTTERVDADYHYGFSAELSGGPYPRAHWLVQPELAELTLRVRQDATPEPGVIYDNIADALVYWADRGRPNAIIRIQDSGSYALPETLLLGAAGWLVIESSDGARALLQAVESAGMALEIATEPGPDGMNRPELTLSGVVLEGFIHVTGDIGRLRLLHSTLIPGRCIADTMDPAYLEPSLLVEELDADSRPINTHLRTEIAFSIVGALRMPTHADSLWVTDSIIDSAPAGGNLAHAVNAIGTADERAPMATLERVTIFGDSWFQQLSLASEVLFVGAVQCVQRQEGCVRFSFVPAESRTPRRYRCQPDLEISSRIASAEEEAQAAGMTYTDTEWAAIRDSIRTAVHAWLVPSFTDTRFGQPAYAELRLTAPPSISTGAADGAEMGVFCHLKRPQRETNLRVRLDEYLPFGRHAGLVYLTYSRTGEEE